MLPVREKLSKKLLRSASFETILKRLGYFLRY
jgi:hypothetical protein